MIQSLQNQWVFVLSILLVLSSCSEDDSPNTPISSPVASFTYNTVVATAGEDITFTDTSVPGTGAISSWNWTFTGATPSSSTEQNPTIVFNSKGEF